MNIVLPKIVAVGVYNSSVAAKNRTVTKNRRTSMFEVEIPIDNGGVSYIDGEEHVISTHTLICAKPGQIRHTRLPFKCYYVHMIVPQGEMLDLLEKIPSFVQTKSTEVYYHLFGEMIRYHSTGSEAESMKIYSLLLETIYLLQKDANGQIAASKQKKSHQDTVRCALQYIENNLSEDLSLSRIAEYLHISPNHFHVVFKAATGKKLHDYIEEQRVRKSIQLMTTTEYTLTRIAQECGFSSQAYYNYVFKKRMGQTPRAYEKQLYSNYNV